MMYADLKGFQYQETMESKVEMTQVTNKYQNHVGCSLGYIFVCVADQFSKPFQSYLGQDVVHNFTATMVKESKSCSLVKRKSLDD